MSKTDMIGIVATIKDKPRLVLDTGDWKRRVYETEIVRRRLNSDKTDTFFLQYEGGAAATAEEELEKIDAGVEVMIAGELRTKNINHPKDWEGRTKIYIRAEVIVVNDPPADQQNEVRLCGRICKEPHKWKTRKHRKRKREITTASMIVAVNEKSGAHYIPCVCWGEIAEAVAGLKVGTYVEIEGRFQSREYVKRIESKQAPFLCISHEVAVYKMGYESEETEENEEAGKE